ncbi:hypothetical protein E6C27_scaffold174G00280 [Cucumis melo var. makuwa]|uniref:Uncharacterized protein n=1 Tax=Cucumis melo var. makuwa TaxID=1194695 RepID=A0A5A7UBD7_CUCMM|nr:hypothetical protein E6C27_scaffold174G00280 [Cucumis melo var. makuwa]
MEKGTGRIDLMHHERLEMEVTTNAGTQFGYGGGCGGFVREATTRVCSFPRFFSFLKEEGKGKGRKKLASDREGSVTCHMRTQSNFAISDPTSTGDDRAFAVRPTALIHLPGRSDRAPSSFGEVILPSAIQLLLRDDRAFAVRSTVLERSDTFLVWRGGTAINNPTSIEGRSSFFRQIYHPDRSNRTPSSFEEVILPSAIQLLSGDDQTFVVRSIALERSSTFVVWRGDTAISDPTSIEGRSSFCRQIHHPGKSDRVPSSFREVVLSLAIQLLSTDDRAFAVRCTALIHHPGRSDWTPSSFGEVVLPSAIQLLSGDDRAFAVRSTTLVGAIRHLRRLERWSDRTPSSFGEVILPSAIQLLSRDDRAFAVRSTALVGPIGHVHRLERWRHNCTIDIFLEKQR